MQMGEVVRADGGRVEAWTSSFIIIIIIIFYYLIFFNLYIHCGVSSMLLHSLLS